MKNIILIITLLIIAFSANSLEISFQKVKMINVGGIKIGHDIDEIGYKEIFHGTESSGPSDLIFMNKSILLFDYWNKNRLIKINDKFTSFQVLNNDNIETGYNPLLSTIGNKYLVNIDNNASNIKVIDLQSIEVVFDISNRYSNESYFFDLGLYEYGFISLDQFLIGELRDHSFVVIDIKNNKIIEMSGVELTTFFEDNKNIEIKQNKFIFYKNRFMTKSPIKFFEYFSDSNDNFKTVIHRLEKLDFENSAIYNGSDKDGNYYWSKGSGVYIFKENGNLYKLLKVDRKTITKKSPMLKFSIDDEGNLYKLVVKDDKYHLMMIERTW